MKKLIVTVITAVLISMCGEKSETSIMEETAYFYLGTYSTSAGHAEGKADGISLWKVNTATGGLKMTGSSWPVTNSSYICLSKDKRFLYSISEVSEYNGRNDGYLNVFTVNPETKSLTLLETKSSYGPGPAYVSIDKSGRYLLLANYGAGNIVVYPIREDGRLDDPAANIMHHGSSINKSRQSEPHPHSIIVSPDNNFIYAADLGTDKIKTYEFDENSGELIPRENLDIDLPAGSGPRHLVFDPTGKYAYLTLELSNQLAAFLYDNGRLEKSGFYDMLPEDFEGVSYSAEVRVSPEGRFVYASNRGHNSIAVFKIDQNDGTLERIQIISTEGDFPRNFNIDPAGSVLVAGNQNSDTIITYLIDRESGMLQKAGDLVQANSPVMFCFY